MPKTQGSTSVFEHALVAFADSKAWCLGPGFMRTRYDAAVVVAAACWLCSVGSAGAQSAGARLLLFSGTDLWRHGSFLYGGTIWSPGGLDREGFTLKALISGGTYDYLSGALGGARVNGREFTARLMPGWRFKAGTTEVKIFAGLDLQHHDLDRNDPGSDLNGGDAGLRAAFEFWSEPIAETMLAIDGSASTIGEGYALRAATGWRVAKRFYFGPEIQLFGNDGYTQRRIGGHVTALKLGGMEWSAAVGYARDDDDRDSAYVRFGVSRRY